MRLVFAAPLAGLLACSSVPAPSGLEEPLSVRSAQFVSGSLTGWQRPDGGADASPADLERVTSVESLNNLIYPGQAGKKLTGRATAGSFAVALRFADLGSGFWVVPIDAPDPQVPGELTWEAVCDFSAAIPPGFHTLQFAPVSASGVQGVIASLPVCIPALVPDNLHACDPSIPPPAAVIALSWDANVDLDLRVITPDGKAVDAKHPSTSLSPDAGPTSADGVLDRDSNPGCVIDSIRRENLVWQTAPTGTYAVYVNLFDACRLASVRFNVGIYTSEGDPDTGPVELVERFHRSGTLIDLDANGGNGPGLFVTEFTFP